MGIYLGCLRNRKLDRKRRIKWPSEWSHNQDLLGFFVVRDEEYIKIYPYRRWNQIFNSMKDPAKEAWSKKSTTELSLDKFKRLRLPAYCNWISIDLIGMDDHIIIQKSIL